VNQALENRRKTLSAIGLHRAGPEAEIASVCDAAQILSVSDLRIGH
jgi:hypothetical protein